MFSNALLGRTLDWDSPHLQSLTVNLEVYRDNQLLYKATTFAGLVGILTGCKSNAFGVAVNFRSSKEEESEDENQNESENQQVEQFRLPISFLIRHILDTSSTYSNTISKLVSTPIMAPCYIIVVGVGIEGAVITRNEINEEQRRTLTKYSTQSSPQSSLWSRFTSLFSTSFSTSTSPFSSSSLLIQANLDHWLTDEEDDVQESLLRCKLANEMLTGKHFINEEEMWNVLSIVPICDECK